MGSPGWSESSFITHRLRTSGVHFDEIYETAETYDRCLASDMEFASGIRHVDLRGPLRVFIFTYMDISDIISFVLRVHNVVQE